MAIVEKNSAVLLIGGSQVDSKTINETLTYAKTLVAADGGADSALQMGHVPDAVIGDFDSISEAAKAAIPNVSLFPISEQDSTDFDKCLRNIEAPLVLGVGFLGARQDHQLAAYTVLLRYPKRRCILIGEDDLVFLAPPQIVLPLPVGCPVSVFPMAPVRGTSTGLRWPLDGLELAPDRIIATSNEALGEVEIQVGTPKALIILPRSCLSLVVDQLLKPTSSWEC